MFCAPVTFLHYFEKIKREGLFCSPPPVKSLEGTKRPSCFMFLKYCKNVIGVQCMLMYFRSHMLLYLTKG